VLADERYESRAKAPFQLLVVNWSAKITDNSFLQSAGARLASGYPSSDDSTACADEGAEAVAAVHSRCLRWGQAVREAAAFLRLSEITLARWRIEGRGPAYRKFGRRVVYARSDLIAWTDEQTSVSTSSGAGPDRARPPHNQQH
jgi:hypothetical protein